MNNYCEKTYVIIEPPPHLDLTPLQTLQTSNRQYKRRSHKYKTPPTPTSPVYRKMIGKKLMETFGKQKKKGENENESHSPLPLTDDEKPVNFLEGFDVQFEHLFGNPQVQDHFHEYLKRSHNQDGFLFLIAVNNFKNEQDSSTKVRQAMDIVENYLAVGSPFEVNIDNDSRTAVMDIFTKTRQLENRDNLTVPVSVFDTVSGIVRKEIKEDGFPRYIRSQAFCDFAHQQGQEFVVNVLKPALDPKTNATFHISQVLNVPYLRTSLSKFGNRRHEKIIDVYETIQKFKTCKGGQRKEMGVELIEAIYDCEMGMEQSAMERIQDGLDQEVDRIRTGLFDDAEIATCKNIAELYSRFTVSVIFNQCIESFVAEKLKQQ
jgi:hypothetical protein